jgi:ribonucleoside-diphosphate reductase alpha chain
VFYQELTWLCVNQYGAFNSPVWFNVGLYHEYGVGKNSTKGNWFYNPQDPASRARQATQYEYPQCSACFIQSVKDNMESIMHLAYSEAMLFKFGSGTGTDLTPIRSAREKLSGGGRPSGPMSFLKVYDQVANVVKSGGKTRRAAKMNTSRLARRHRGIH